MSPDYNEKQCKWIQDVKKEQTIAFLQRELEEVKKENKELRDRLIKEHLPAEYESWEKVWSGIVETQKERDSLKSQLAAAEARCERLKTALEGMHELCGNYFEESELVCVRDKEIWTAMSKALSESPTDSLTAWFREQTDEVVAALGKAIAEFNDRGPYGIDQCTKALAKLKTIRKET